MNLNNQNFFTKKTLSKNKKMGNTHTNMIEKIDYSITYASTIDIEPDTPTVIYETKTRKSVLAAVKSNQVITTIVSNMNENQLNDMLSMQAVIFHDTKCTAVFVLKSDTLPIHSKVTMKINVDNFKF